MTWGIFKQDSVADAVIKVQKEGWDDMLKSVKDKNGPQPNGGSGKKQGTRYGGSKQKDDESKEKKESVEVEGTEVVEAKVANTDSVRAELSNRPRKPDSEEEAERKKKESDEAWERLMAHAASQKKTNESVELEELEDGTFYDGSDMLGEAKERTSSSYQFTHTPGDAESEKKLADLKAQHKGTGKRVVLQGRLGKNNPNANKYSKSMFGKPGSASSGAHTHQRIKKADAAHHDVYVYDKADTEYNYDEMISEVLSKNASAGKWIQDFIKSDNPKFAGDSKEKRQQRALAAYYAAQKNESTDFDFYAEYSEYIQEEAQKDVVKRGAKEIKHANMKDKQQNAEIMEPHSKGEADFIDQHSILVKDDPTAVKQDCGAGTKATEPKGHGAGHYNGDSKLSEKDKAKVTVKEASIKIGTTETGGEGETIDTEPKDKSSKKSTK